MTFMDYALDLGLIGIVVFQLKWRRVTARSVLLPIAVVVWAAFTYLKGVPAAGNDLVLVIVGAAAGGALGIGAALSTLIRRQAGGVAVARAGAVAAVLWVVGVGSRLAFQLYATHGGAPSIARFSAAHHITSGEAWVATLIVMALTEVVGRSAVLAARAWKLGCWRSFTSVSMMGVGETAH